MTRQRKPSAHAELDRLSQAVAAAAMADREAHAAVRTAQTEVEAIRERIREAHGKSENTAELGRDLRLAKEQAEQSELEQQGIARRTERAAEARQRFLAENAEKLLEELRPEADAVVADLTEHARSLVEADRRWSDLQGRVSSYLAAMSIQPVSNAPDSHSLAGAVREVRRALHSAVASPLPHFESQRAQRADEARKRKLRQERNAA